MGQLQVATTLSISLVLVLLCTFHQAWGGCSRFGHSCFGAHGKRSDGIPIRMGTNNGDIRDTKQDLLDGLSMYGYGLPQQPPDYQLPIPIGTGIINSRNYQQINPYLMEWLASSAHRRPPTDLSQQELSRESEIRE